MKAETVDRSFWNHLRVPTGPSASRRAAVFIEKLPHAKTLRKKMGLITIRNAVAESTANITLTEIKKNLRGFA
ncbi:hypothetical protein [Desulfosarcina widdelii]|uniref:hypothetical protein n=1 Tax=Desulfosarcina widdelii TaxID=947919 RepID=UPI0012D2AC64|nr:hypothetical protein [Desulfosarcina widdelii]